MTLEYRKDCPEGYYYAVVNGKVYSVVDFGATMKNHPMPEGIFLGWEAIPLRKDGGLDSDQIFRGETWEDLYDQL